MDTEVEIGDGTEDKGSMWALEQQLDQPMDEEAERVRNMYREKVRTSSPASSPVESAFPFLVSCFGGICVCVRACFLMKKS